LREEVRGLRGVVGRGIAGEKRKEVYWKMNWGVINTCREELTRFTEDRGGEREDARRGKSG
jgi:hypothetical protein